MYEARNNWAILYMLPSTARVNILQTGKEDKAVARGVEGVSYI